MKWVSASKPAGSILRKPVSAPPRSVRPFCRSAIDEFARIVVDVDPEEPHVIKEVELRAIPPPRRFSHHRMTEAEGLKAFRSYLDQAAADGHFSGAVLVAKNGKPVFTAVYGMADREKKIPDQLNTQFRIGSMNKMFTATAVLQLVQKANQSQRSARQVSHRLSRTKKSCSGHHSPPPHSHGRHRRFLRSGVPTSIASSCARCWTTSNSTASAAWPLSPAAAGNTATTVSCCLAWLSRKPVDRTTTAMFANTSSSPLE